METGYALGGLDRGGLRRFLCEALRTDSVSVAMALMDAGFFATSQPVAIQESITPGDGFATHSFLLGSWSNELRHSYNESSRGGERFALSLSVSREAQQGVWFQRLPEARAWLETAGLSTRTRESGVEGYAPGSRESAADPNSKTPSTEFGFTVYVTVFNYVEVNWSRPDQMKYGQGFCGTVNWPLWRYLGVAGAERGAASRAIGSDRGGDRTRGPRIKSALLYH